MLKVRRLWGLRGIKFNRKDAKKAQGAQRIMTENEIAAIIFDASLKIHKHIGPGLLESAYEECLFYELRQNGLLVEKQKAMPFMYNEVRMDVGYRLDLLVENKVVIEVKACEGLTDVHLAQVLTYLKLTNCKLGLLINFNVALLKNGFRRVVNKL